MKQLKRALATAGTGAVLALSMVGAASADVTCTTSNSGVNGAQVQTCVDASTNTTYTVSGNCSGIFQTNTTQSQSSGSTGGAGLVGGNNNSTTTQTQTGSNVTFAPNCSVTNVSNVSQVAAAPAAASAQVKAPAGGVHAGGGAGVSAASSTASIAGLIASAGSLGLGVIVRKKALLGL